MLFELEVDWLFQVSEAPTLASEKHALKLELAAECITPELSDRWNQKGTLWWQSLSCAKGSPSEIEHFVARERRRRAIECMRVERNLDERVQLPSAGDLLVLAAGTSPPKGDAQTRITVFDGWGEPVVRQRGQGFLLNPGDLDHGGAMLIHDTSRHLTLTLFDRKADLVEQHRLISYNGAHSPSPRVRQ